MATKAKMTSKGESSEHASEGAAHVELEQNVAVANVSAPESATGEATAANEAGRQMQRANKELHVRVRELELQLAGGSQSAEGVAADYGDATEESTSIIALIKDLHGQIDAANELKEALEADLTAMKGKLAEEQVVRAEMEARAKLLEAKAVLGDQLREDLSFVEEERNEIARRLEQAAAQLGKTTEERDGLAEQNAAEQTRVKNLQTDKITLEAKVLNLEEMVADTDRLQQELVNAREETRRLKEHAQGLKGKLDATDTAKNSLELELATARSLIRSQNEQVDEMKENLAALREEVGDLRAKLDREQAENANLVECNKREDHELKALNARFESAKKELDLSKKAIRNIRAAAMRTASHVREQPSTT